MTVVVFAKEKGGAGASTLATNYYVCSTYVYAPEEVVLVDIDPQGTSFRWSERRRKNKAVTNRELNCELITKSVYSQIEKLERKFEMVIVDVGGRVTESMCEALQLADILISPFQASQPDLETGATLQEIVREYVPKTCLKYTILCRTPTNPSIKEERDARNYIKKYLPGFTDVGFSIKDRKVYRDALALGLGVIELNNPKAVKEINALGELTYEQLHTT